MLENMDYHILNVTLHKLIDSALCFSIKIEIGKLHGIVI